MCPRYSHSSWRSSGTTAPMEVLVVPIKRAQRDLPIDVTWTTVGAMVNEPHPVEGQNQSNFEILVG